VQHHHAHIAACLVEHGLTGPVLGVAFDGTGCGPEGALWGGEFLLASLAGYRRLAHLRPIALPGGEAAVREPWATRSVRAPRCGRTPRPARAHPPPRKLRAVAELSTRRLHAPLATGAGRCVRRDLAACARRFDASHLRRPCADGARRPSPARTDAPPYPFDWRDAELDLRPTVRALAADLRAGAARPLIAARFHETLAAGIAAGCARQRDAGAPSRIALSGGCFANRRLLERTAAWLEARDFTVYSHHRVPPETAASRSVRSPSPLPNSQAERTTRMCLGIPGEIVDLHLDDGVKRGRVRFGGITRDVCMEFQPDAVPGDYVLVHVGFAISTLDAEEAARTLRLIEELGQASELELLGEPLP